MSDDDLREVGVRLAAEFPAPAGRRGWMIANLTHAYERTHGGVEEVWSADFYGPTDLYTEWHEMAGRPRFSSTRLSQGVVGTIEAPTADLLVEQVRMVIDNLGLRDLKDPVLTR